MFLAIAILCGLVFWLAPAEGALVTIEIEAVVDSVEDRGPGDGYLEGKIEAGDIITGFYVYESTTPDSSPLDSVQGNYWHYAPPAGIALTVGGFNFMTDPFNVAFHLAVRNNSPGDDSYWLASENNLPLSNGILVDGIVWQLNDSIGSPFVSDALLPTAPVLTDWQWNVLDFHGERGGFHAFAHVTSAIPEPGIIVLLSMGGLFSRKRW